MLFLSFHDAFLVEKRHKRVMVVGGGGVAHDGPGRRFSAINAAPNHTNNIIALDKCCARCILCMLYVPSVLLVHSDSVFVGFLA